MSSSQTVLGRFMGGGGGKSTFTPLSAIKMVRKPAEFVGGFTFHFQPQFWCYTFCSEFNAGVTILAPISCFSADNKCFVLDY